jgi:hypothetical protein
MTLPAPVARHHTAWVHCDHCAPRAVRYALDGDHIVCFGDELPEDALDGQRVFVSVHEIAGGPALADLSGTVHDVDASDVDANARLELLEHVPLGRTMPEVERAITRHCARRLVTLT